jgi:hypothetical protein
MGMDKAGSSENSELLCFLARGKWGCYSAELRELAESGDKSCGRAGNGGMGSDELIVNGLNSRYLMKIGLFLILTDDSAAIHVTSMKCACVLVK